MKLKNRLSAILTTLAMAALVPFAALAADCGEYPLTPEEFALLGDASIEVPRGVVPVIMRCDTNGDGAVDMYDIRDISMHRNQPAAHPDDPMDWDRNGSINALDARGCVLACDLPRCAVSRVTGTLRPSGGGVTEDSQCYQRTDLDGDGSEDIAAIFEYTGAQVRGGNWTLETIIIYRDEQGELQQKSYPYSGKRSPENGGLLQQHLSLQPAGIVDLAPGRVMLDQPGVVSYRDGKPAVLYYYQNGQMNRAFYGVID